MSTLSKVLKGGGKEWSATLLMLGRSRLACGNQTFAHDLCSLTVSRTYGYGSEVGEDDVRQDAGFVNAGCPPWIMVGEADNFWRVID